MKLRELEPEFIRYETRIEPYNVIVGDQETWRERGCPTKEVTGPREYHIFVDTLAEAQGIFFLCPKCFAENKGRVGTHHVQVSFAGRGVPDSQGVRGNPPPRWDVSGTGFDDLTITPSILIRAPACGWHGFVTNGEIK